MTVQTEISRSGPYAGAGTTGPFTVGFRFLADSHLRVIRTGVDGVDSDLVLATDYSVTGAGNDTGTVTLAVALPIGATLTIIRNAPFTQEADYVDNDSFPAESHETALDLLTMQTQQIKEAQDRALALSPTSDAGVSTELPAPLANNLLAWNPSANALRNLDPSAIAGVVSYGTFLAETFDGTGAQVDFVVAGNPLTIGNLDVAVSGVVQSAGINFTFIPPSTVRFITGAPAAGTDNVLIRYGSSLAMGEAAAVAGQTAIGTALITAPTPKDAFNAIAVNGGDAGGSIRGAKGATVASAATTLLFAPADGNLLHISGAVGINSLGTSGLKPGYIVKGVFDGAPLVTPSASLILNGGGAAIQIRVGDTFDAWCDTSGIAYMNVTRADGSSVVVSPCLFGLTLLTAGSSTTMTVAAGRASDSTNSTVMVLPSSIAKTQATFAAGAGGGKLSAAAIAPNTTYHWFEIGGQTVAPDVGFDVSPTAPTMPTNYTTFRRIGSWKTDGSSNWVAMTQDGDLFQLSTPVLDVTSTNQGTSAVTATLGSIPTGINVQAVMNVSIASGPASVGCYLSDLATTDLAPSFTAAPIPNITTWTGNANFSVGGINVRTNTSAQIRTRLTVSEAATIIRISTIGWIDSRGRNA